MIRMAIFYPKTSDSHFDMDYYLNKHMPLLIARLSAMGLQKGEVDEGLGTAVPDQPAPYAVITYLIFDTIEHLQQGFGSHGAELMGDIPNFTNVQPVTQISRIAL